MASLKNIILALIWALFPGTLLGATIWSIPGGLWSTTSTSGPDCGCTPGAGDDIIVDDIGASITGLGDLTGTIDILNGGDLAIDGITIKASSVVTVRTGGSLIIAVDFKPKETSLVIVESGGTITVGNRIQVSQDAIFVIRGTVNVGGDKMVVNNNASLIIESSGELNMTDPTSTIDINAVNGTLIVDGTIGTPEEFKLSGGTLGGSGTITHGGTCSGGGTINGLDQTGYCDPGLMNAIPLSSLYTTFYSFGGGGAWNDDNFWTLTSDGSSGAVGGGIWPGRYDNVIIRSGHPITIDATGDNNFNGISPDDLYRVNVGNTWPTSSVLPMFYHRGDIKIDESASLSATVEVMLEGYSYINGTFTATEDFVNLGNMEVTSSATFNTDDDIILSGNSFTTFNNTSTSDDDIYLDHTDALLCGSGTFNVGADVGNPLDPTIQLLNGATEAQICSSLTIICTTNCGGFSPPGSPGNFSLGYTGPGGVAGTDGTSELVVWLDANSISQSTGTNLTTWSDLSGYGNHANAPGGNEPVFNTSQLNGFPAVQFIADNTDYMLVSDDATLDHVTISIIIVANIESASDAIAGVITKKNAPYVSGYEIIRDAISTDFRFSINGTINRVDGPNPYGSYVISTNIYDKINLEQFQNENSEGTDSYTLDIVANSNDFFIGNNPLGTNRFLEGDIAEIIIMNRNVNLAERIIMNNYLAAKYNQTLGNNDVYLQDDDAGEFDFEVTGIGQATDGSYNKDAQGTGLVRINLASSIDNNEFLMWGHDGTDITTINTTDVDGTIIEARYDRVWSVSENDDTGTAVDVGTVRLTFDASNAPASIVGSDLRLMISRDDALFDDNDIAPQAGSYNIDNQLVTFSNVDLQDGDYFTFGTTDNTNSPLPINLISFTATADQDFVELNWITAGELNNDFFTIERSRDAVAWESVVQIKGMGTTDIEKHYSTTDDLPYYGLSFYRLKQTDFDGTFTYSRIVSVVLESTETLSIYPNPSRGAYTLKTGFALENAQIIIFDMKGRFIPSKVTRKEYSADIQIPNTPPGFYILEIHDGLRVFKQKVLIDY